MSGLASRSQESAFSVRALIELTFHVAIFMAAMMAVGVVARKARQIEKLVPQPQEAVALGFRMRNDWPIRSSTKSISEPAR